MAADIVTPATFAVTFSRDGRQLATALRADPPRQHVARVGEDEDGETDYRCACLLAEMVGIDLEDGSRVATRPSLISRGRRLLAALRRRRHAPDAAPVLPHRQAGDARASPNLVTRACYPR